MANTLTPTGQVYSPSLPDGRAYPEPAHDLGDFTPGVSPCQSLADRSAIDFTPGLAGPVRVQPTQQWQAIGPGSGPQPDPGDSGGQ